MSNRELKALRDVERVGEAVMAGLQGVNPAILYLAEYTCIDQRLSLVHLWLLVISVIQYFTSHVTAQALAKASCNAVAGHSHAKSDGPGRDGPRSDGPRPMVFKGG